MDLAANDEIRMILDPSLVINATAAAATDAAADGVSQQGVEDLGSTSTDGGDSSGRCTAGKLKHLFDDKDLSTIVQQSQDINAHGNNDLAQARIREKERQLTQCEAQVTMLYFLCVTSD